MNRFAPVALIAALVFVSPARVAAEPAEGPKPVVVPFKLLQTGHFLVKVKLNGKGPYQLIFDTGAPTMLINNRIAKDSGVITRKTPRPLFAPFGSMGAFNIDEMELGGLRAEDVQAMVMDHPTVTAFSDFFERQLGKIDGIVGFPFFARYKMTVDYKNKELTFVPSGYKPTDVMQQMMRSIMFAGAQDDRPKVVGSAGYWGLVADKEDFDDDPGVIVEEVQKDSPAAKAGIQKGDRVLTVGGRWTDSIPDLYQAASHVAPGKTADVEIQRGGKKLTVKVTPTSGL